mgnify:CR=1 FL=1
MIQDTEKQPELWPSDFPSYILNMYDVTAISPDDFILLLWAENPQAIREVLSAQVAALKNPPRSMDDVLSTLERAGLKKYIENQKISRRVK